MSKMNNSTFLTLIFSIFAAFAISGCSTIDGAGKDIESVGEAIQE